MDDTRSSDYSSYSFFFQIQGSYRTGPHHKGHGILESPCLWKLPRTCILIKLALPKSQLPSQLQDTPTLKKGNPKCMKLAFALLPWMFLSREAGPLVPAVLPSIISSNAVPRPLGGSRNQTPPTCYPILLFGHL